MKPNQIKILLIEDDKFISEIYYRKLTDSGFKVELAQDGLDGIQAFERFQPDLVLLDIMLPEKNGWEVLRELKAIKDSKSKIVMLTNLGEKDKIQQALKMGADDYLIKASLTPTELIEIIKDKI
ncbi:MAG: response regulator [Candidatus Moranbacteria bacterium]|nr:response regulator [Candidatus Moranbacteria bacterium]